MPVVTIVPESITLTVAEGERLLDILLRNEFDLLSICGGMGDCETCVVQVQYPESRPKKKQQENEFCQRLACQTVVDRDIIVKIPDWREIF